ncbi:unnamed protein product [Paramecium octaurelia]|uniref:RING-type domain-containing protein n=1 Tax=Paramecium octaurelia TaxID=43137 RepID=A0A8S1U2Z5_PAROT|nr:unnamed protein product [Paramecium octaurelia]
MLNHFLKLILTIEITRSYLLQQVNFNADNQWQTLSYPANQSIFIVDQLDTKYCYIRITLSEYDPGLSLIADYQQYPNISLYTKYKQGHKVDRISQVENRKTRFLKLQSGKGKIYILATGNNTKDKYLISISGSNEEQCDNDCSKKGVCQANGCSCHQSYIGNDCHQISEELLAGTSKQLNFSNSQQLYFFYIDLRPMQEFTLEIDFTWSQKGVSDFDICRRCLNFWYHKTKALLKQNFFSYQKSIPCEFNNLLERTKIERGFSKLTLPVPSNLSVQSQILFFAIEKDQNSVDYVELQMDIVQLQVYEKKNNDSEETNRLLQIILPTVIGTIILLFLIYYFLIRRRMLVKQLNNAVPNPLENSYIIPNIRNSELNVPPYPTICSICLEELNIRNMAIVKIQCDHTFHLKCILQWARQQENYNQDNLSNCPNCILNENFIKSFSFQKKTLSSSFTYSSISCLSNSSHVHSQQISLLLINP